jgi:hypothetical protein
MVGMSSMACCDRAFAVLDIVKLPARLVAATHEVSFVARKVKVVDLIFVLVLVGSQNHFVLKLH